MASSLSRREFVKKSGLSGFGLLTVAHARDEESSLAATSSVPAASAQRAAQSEPGRTDVVVGLFSEDKSGVTPMWSSEVIGSQIGDQLFDALTRVEDYETVELLPNAAVEWGQEDETTYTFKLREGVQFHDGYGEMTADDAAWSINTWLETVGRAGVSSYIDRAAARDKYTLEVTLLTPFSNFLKTWSHTRYATVYSRKATEELGREEYNRRGIGTGPFRLEEWNVGVSLSIVRNEEYWDPNLPLLDRITFLPIPDPFVKLEMLRNGEIDFCDAIDYRDLPDVAGNPSLKIVRPLTDAWDYISFNLRLPDGHPLRVREVRQAIGYAISRAEIADLIYHGFAEADDDPFTPGFPGDNPDPEFFPLAGDPDKARDLLNQAGYGDGLEITCITSAKPALRQQLELIAGQLSDVGITVNIQNLDLATYSQRVGSSHDYEMALEDISLSGPDSDAAVYFFLHGQATTFSGYSNPTVDQLLDQGRSEPDPEKRNDIYQMVAQHVYEDAPMLYTAHVPQIWLMNSNLDGFRPGRMEWNIYMDQLHWNQPS